MQMESHSRTRSFREKLCGGGKVTKARARLEGPTGKTGIQRSKVNTQGDFVVGTFVNCLLLTISKIRDKVRMLLVHFSEKTHPTLS